MVTPATITDLGNRGKESMFRRVRRARGMLLLALQAGVSAGLAWFIAHELLDRPRPFFAPIAAVIVLNSSVGQKLRRGVELLVGVATGILLGDAVVYVIGTGFIQISLVVAAAILVAAFLGGSPTLIAQAASSAVLVVTLPTQTGGLYYSRFVDALIGGVTGLLVMVLLLQVNPLTRTRRATRPLVNGLADALTRVAAAIAAEDAEAAGAVQAELDGSGATLEHFHDQLEESVETSKLAPVRWHTKAPLARYIEAAPHLEQAVQNAKVLLRRSVTLIRDGEDEPVELVASIRVLAEAIRQLETELAGGRQPSHSPELTTAAVVLAGIAYRSGVGFHGSVLVAQVRAIGTDLLLACGYERKQAERLIRRAAARRN